MKIKTFLSVLLSASLLAAMLAGCASGTAQQEQTPAAPEQEVASQPEAPEAEETEEENYETGDASLDNPRNQDGIGETELLVVSFGTSYNDNRRLTIGAIEEAMEQAFPDLSVRRAFTSQIIIDHVARRDGEIIDNVGQALDRAVANGVKQLIVQPTHLMDGYEYNDVVNELAQYADAFEKISVGTPLLTNDEDFRIVAQAIVDATAKYDDGKTAICFMGHGTGAASNQVYPRMQELLTELGHAHCFIGTVEAAPTVEDVLAKVREGGFSRVVLRPLMIVAGDHANNDMAGDEPDSWKSIFEAAGFEVICETVGLGEMTEIQELLVAHAKAAMPEEKAPVASADDMAAPVEVGEEGMTPIYADQLPEGTYAITVDSSSSMFQITACELTVANGEMTATMHMGGTGYLYVYSGTGEDAAAAEEHTYIPFAEQADGTHTFTIPVPALNAAVDCAAFSKKKEMWYDRTLVFRADSLPNEALQALYPTVESLSLADGSYTVEVTLAGGSGKASVASPAQMRVENGVAYATVVWSSSNYDYVRIGEEKYFPLTLEGGSTFEIPVAGFDRALAVAADTTAMSTPHEIDYTLTFDAASIQRAE